MKVSKSWLKQLVALNISMEQLEELIPLRIQGGINEVTDDYFELDLKGYNRADLLSMRGVAQEVAAITSSRLKFSNPDTSVASIAEKQPHTPVNIAEESLSPLQCVARIEGLKFGKSSEGVVRKLSDSGMRPVNNIVDITNLIMLEYGQPLHAFDASTVKDDTINVRLAEEEEEIVTLDNKPRKLTANDIILADQEKALDVAGVMGGKDTEVTEKTTTILLSASLFNPQRVRSTAQRLGLHSEASKRFQHGLTKTRLLQALDAAIKTYEEVGGQLTALTIVGDTKDPVKTVDLSLAKLNSLIGIELEPEQVENYLTKLGFNLSHSENRSWRVTVPYWRLDIEIEEDLIEEVARLYGYEKIPAKPLTGDLPEKVNQSLFNLITQIKDQLARLGLTEVQTYSFYSTQVLQAVNVNQTTSVKVANPMSKETEYLRQDIWPNLLEVVDKNLRQGFDDIAVFEVGKVYSPQVGKLPKEEYRLSIALMNGSDNPVPELVKVIKTTLNKLGLEIELEPDKVPEAVKDLFHPTRFVKINKGTKQIAGIDEVHPRVLNQLGINKRVAVFEINLSDLLSSDPQ